MQRAEEVDVFTFESACVYACAVWAYCTSPMMETRMPAYTNHKRRLTCKASFSCGLNTCISRSPVGTHNDILSPQRPPLFHSRCPLTGCFVPWQIHSSWLPYRTLGKWDTNATVSAVSLPRSEAVARGDETAARTPNTTMVGRKQHNTPQARMFLDAQHNWMSLRPTVFLTLSFSLVKCI